MTKSDENAVIVDASLPLGLIGGGPVSPEMLAQLSPHVGAWIAADGGADHLRRAGLPARAVIGDLDSISEAARATFADQLHLIKEQQTTDFDKALRSVQTPLIFGLGFAGGLIHHSLAVMNTLVRHPKKRCIILDEFSVLAHCPAHLDLDLEPGDDISLFPMQSLAAASRGLVWPLDGLTLSPAGQIATSNRAATGPVSLRPDRPGLLVILPRARLSVLARGLYPGFSSSAH